MLMYSFDRHFDTVTEDLSTNTRIQLAFIIMGIGFIVLSPVLVVALENPVIPILFGCLGVVFVLLGCSCRVFLPCVVRKRQRRRSIASQHSPTPSTARTVQFNLPDSADSNERISRGTQTTLCVLTNVSTQTDLIYNSNENLFEDESGKSEII